MAAEPAQQCTTDIHSKFSCQLIHRGVRQLDAMQLLTDHMQTQSADCGTCHRGSTYSKPPTTETKLQFYPTSIAALLSLLQIEAPLLLAQKNKGSHNPIIFISTRSNKARAAVQDKTIEACSDMEAGVPST
jgi:hypothetical protein